MSVINGFAVNAAARAAWVKSALVAASATALGSCAGVYAVGGAATAAIGATSQAASNVVRVAAAQGAGKASVSLAARPILGGRLAARATCDSSVFLLNTVQANAVGAAVLTGLATADAELGTATGDLTAEGATAPIKVRFAQAVGPAMGASGVVAATYRTVVGAVGQALPLAVETTLQLDGESGWQHEGFARAAASAVAAVAAIYQLSRPLGVVASQSVVAATRVTPATVTTAATLAGAGTAGQVFATNAAGAGNTVSTATGDRFKLAVVRGTVRARVTKAFSAAARNGLVAAPAGQAVATTTAVCKFGGRVAGVSGLSATLRPADNYFETAAGGCLTSSQVTATRTLPADGLVGSGIAICNGITLAKCHLSLAYLYSSTSGDVTPSVTVAARSDSVIVSSGTATTKVQQLGTVDAPATASLTSLTLANSYLGQATAPATASLTSLTLANSYLGQAAAALVAQGGALGDRLALATVDAALTATGRALGLRRGDLNAPPERSMILSYEPRGMIVPEAERTLWVPA